MHRLVRLVLAVALLVFQLSLRLQLVIGWTDSIELIHLIRNSTDDSNLLLASDNRPLSILIVLDICAVFNTIAHNIFSHILEHVTGIKGEAPCWFKSVLSDRFPFVRVSNTSSMHKKGSVHILFTYTYMHPVGIRKHMLFKCNRDDTQLNSSMNQVKQIN